jgi:t-SNARE complex subunit (syntaxin)
MEGPLYEITDAGLDWVLGGQELDSAGREARLAERKKWQERGIEFLISIIVGVVLMWLKWYFVDKK